MTMPMNSSVDTVEDLRALMAEHGLTQKQVAGMACVSIKTVESWLADKSAASYRVMHLRHLRSIRFALQQPAAKSGRKA